MSVTTTKNSLQVMIGKAIDLTASVQLTSPSTTSTYIADGEIVALNNTGGILTPGSTITDSPYISLVQRSGNVLLYSNRIPGFGVTSYTGVDGSAGQEQIYYIGYNGSTQSIDVTAGNDFFVNVNSTHDWQNWTNQQNKRTYFETFLTPTARKVALGIAKQINEDPGSCVKAEVINSENTAVAAIGGSATASVVKNSKYITFSSASHGLVAGDTVRIGVTGSGTGVKIPVYEVASASGTSVVLTSPYVGPTNSALPNADMEEITTATTTWGIRLTGLPLDFSLDFIKFMRASFRLSLVGFGDTVITKTQEMSEGQGDGRKVAELESFAQGFENPSSKMSVPFAHPNRTDAVKTTTATLNTTNGDDYLAVDTLYDCITIQFGNRATATMTAPVTSLEELRIYIKDDSTKTMFGRLLSQLNPWMASTPRAFENVTI